MSHSPQQLRSRLRFDWEVASAMFGEVFDGVAYRNAEDLERQANPIANVNEADRAHYYRITYHVPTLVGRGQLQPETIVGFNTNVGGYPHSDPTTWLVPGPKTPWSPHFRAGAPVCLGSMWREAKGEMLLAVLMLHVCHLLNWDEHMESGYAGWNPDSIKYWREQYAGGPLNPELRYPKLPTGITHGLTPNDDLFGFAAPGRAADDRFGAPAAVLDSLFSAG